MFNYDLINIKKIKTTVKKISECQYQATVEYDTAIGRYETNVSANSDIYSTIDDTIVDAVKKLEREIFLYKIKNNNRYTYIKENE